MLVLGGLVAVSAALHGGWPWIVVAVVALWVLGLELWSRWAGQAIRGADSDPQRGELEERLESKRRVHSDQKARLAKAGGDPTDPGSDVAKALVSNSKTEGEIMELLNDIAEVERHGFRQESPTETQAAELPKGETSEVET